MRVRAVTFDVYSALCDTQRGLAEALAIFLRRKGATADPLVLADEWRRRQRHYLLVANSLDREPACNRVAVEAALQATLRPRGLVASGEDLQELVGAWERLPFWPEAEAVLLAIQRRGLLVAALSNGDEKMLSRLLSRLPVPWDAIVSTEGGRFKPHPSAYQKALDRLRVGREELLHVAGSATDAAGATAFGIRTVWVRRGAEEIHDARWAPAHECSDLWGVLRLLEAV